MGIRYGIPGKWKSCQHFRVGQPARATCWCSGMEKITVKYKDPETLQQLIGTVGCGVPTYEYESVAAHFLLVLFCKWSHFFSKIFLFTGVDNGPRCIHQQTAITAVHAVFAYIGQTATLKPTPGTSKKWWGWSSWFQPALLPWLRPPQTSNCRVFPMNLLFQYAFV